MLATSPKSGQQTCQNIARTLEIGSTCISLAH